MQLLERLFLKLELRDHLTENEKAILAASAGSMETYEAGQDIVRENETQTVSRLLVEGLAARAKTLPDGGRQLTELHVPGDFMDLHSFLLKRLDHNVVALRPVRLLTFPHHRLREITETQPHLTRILWLNTLLDAAIHREWIVSAGRRSSAEQMANLFCELISRYQSVQLSDGKTCPLPMTQAQLGDVTGISTVHVNRVIQELRRDRLIEWSGGMLTVPDFEQLAAFAQFDPAYLNLNCEPR